MDTLIDPKNITIISTAVVTSYLTGPPSMYLVEAVYVFDFVWVPWTMDLYIVTRTVLLQSLKLRRKNPRVLETFVEVIFACFFQHRSSLIVTQKQELLSTTSSWCPSK